MESDPRLAQLEAQLAHNQQLLWAGGAIKVSQVPVTSEFEKILLSLQGLQQLERGLENIEKILESEKKGLEALNKKQGKQTVYRVSRLLIITEGGSERFNRNCERLLRDHADRLLGLRIDLSDAQLIERLYGSDALTKALLVSHRDAVTRVLWSMLC